MYNIFQDMSTALKHHCNDAY